MPTLGPVRPKRSLYAAATPVALLGSVGRAQDAGCDDRAELAKRLLNPVSALISVPLQHNYDFAR